MVRLVYKKRLALVTIDNPPVNALSSAVVAGIQHEMGIALHDPHINVIVLTGNGRIFSAGADIRAFQQVTLGQMPYQSRLEFLLSIENSMKPVIVAMNGTALGGGLELALAGHYRLTAPLAKVGQPEVKVGLIPGAGGTQRLPRLAGFAKALEMCSLGEPIPAREAVFFGIADKVIEGDFLEGVLSFANEVAHKAFIKTRDRVEKIRQATPDLFKSARAKARMTKPEQCAPLAAIDAIEGGTALSFEEGCQLEAKLFQKCLYSDQSQNLIRAFFDRNKS